MCIIYQNSRFSNLTLYLLLFVSIGCSNSNSLKTKAITSTELDTEILCPNSKPIRSHQGIKSLKESTYSIKNSGWFQSIRNEPFNFQVDRLVEYEVTIYSKEGNPIEKNKFDSLGAIISNETYKFNHYGQLLETTGFRKNKDENLIRTTHIQEYDRAGNITKTSTFFDDELDYKTVFRYDNNCNLSIIVFGSDGNIITIDSLIINKNGDVTQYDQYLPDGTVNYKSLSIYDNRGNEIKWEEFDKEGVLNGRKLKKYDENDNLIKHEFGILLFGESWENSKHCFRYAYQYDQHNNWVKQVRYDIERPFTADIGRPVELIIRQYEYYD